MKKLLVATAAARKYVDEEGKYRIRLSLWYGRVKISLRFMLTGQSSKYIFCEVLNKINEYACVQGIFIVSRTGGVKKNSRRLMEVCCRG